MDLQFSEDTKCNHRKKCCNQLSTFPIYTVAFSYNEIYDKVIVSEDSNDLKYPIDNGSTSTTTLKNKTSVEVTKTNMINALDITERPVVPLNNVIDDTQGPVISINNAIDYFVNVKYKNNNNNVKSEIFPSSLKYIKKLQKTKQRTIFSTLKSKPKKFTRLVKIKNTYFKTKNNKNNINKNLEFFYDRAKTKCSNTGKNHRKIYLDSILNGVPLARILKKVLAKENLLDDFDKISLNENHNGDKISFASDSSEHTLTRERSISSGNSDFINTKPPSVIDISNYLPIKNINSDVTNKNMNLISSKVNIEIDNIEHPFKTDIVAVAVARIENASILNCKKESCDKNGRENFITKESLTSAESYLSQTSTVSSTISFEMANNLGKEDILTTIDLNDSGVSSQTLTENLNFFNITSESDKFVIAKTSSYFRNDHIDSNITLTPMISLNNESDVQEPKLSPPKLLKSTLLDTLINVSMLPKITTSVQDNMYFDSELKNVIITEELRNSLPLNRLDNEGSKEDKYSKSLFKKSCLANDDFNRQNGINFPNEETIKELLFNRDQANKKSCSQEFRNYMPFSELWEKLTIFLDVALKKLEEAITDKITQEMKKTLDRLDKYINTSIEDPKGLQSETYLIRKSKEANIISTMESGKSKSLQCGSLENNVLDELVKQFNLKGLKAYKIPPLKLKEKSNKSDDFFEVLKPSLAPRVSNDQGNGDSIYASSSEGMGVKYSKLQYLPMFMINIVRFVKENLLVITSVPLFCFTVFLIYTFLAMLANI